MNVDLIVDWETRGCDPSKHECADELRRVLHQHFAADIFHTDAEALVNPVNCVGVMGKGLAAEFKKRFPGNFASYKKACDQKKLKPGIVQVCETMVFHPSYIINFPTKRHWRDKSRLEDIEIGLQSLVHAVHHHKIRSVAVPRLGCGLGGLDWADVKPLIKKAFAELPKVKLILC